MTTNKKPLWEETRELHHACEAHNVGGSMATGKPPRIWYKAWLMALYQIHSAVDPNVPKCIDRTMRIFKDLQGMDNEPEVKLFKSASDYVASLNNEKSIAGAAYVLTGAHLMGGEIMRRRLEGFPTLHLEWDDRKEALAVLQTYRTRDDITQEARDCFQALLNIMDEIESLYII
jgi:hypothetical protein